MQIQDIQESVKKLNQYAELLSTPDVFFRQMNGHTTELSLVLTAFEIAAVSKTIIDALEKADEKKPMLMQLKSFEMMCPACGCKEDRKTNYCPNCGQKYRIDVRNGVGYES